jgi:hypothetical protein
MTSYPAIEVPTDTRSRDVPMVRKCLKCRATFQSDWAGERVCSHCKSLTSWRNVAPPGFCPARSRR